ncbi:MAG: hypothetical protein IT427_18505 [Pirellulales bacterium]|nr:hypothetical protein [Pirellulales bacterium]
MLPVHALARLAVRVAISITLPHFFKEQTMTRTLALSISTVAALCISSWGIAADESEPDRSPKQRHEALFKELDDNHDGLLTSDDVPDEQRRLFERLKRRGDANGDSKLSLDEFLAGLEEDRPNQLDRPPRGPDEPHGENRSARPSRDVRRGDEDRPDAGRPENPRRGRPEGRPEFFGPEGFRGPIMGPALMRTLDANGDGKLSSSEIADAATALKKLDKNSDGEISREELLPPQFAGGFGGGFRGRPGGDPGRPNEPGRPGEPGRPDGGMRRPNPEALLARLKQLDKDGDGKFKKDELPERLQELFDKLDANGDEEIDEVEMKQALPRLMRRFGEGGRPGNPGGDAQPRRERSKDTETNGRSDTEQSEHREGRSAEDKKADGG